MNNNPQFALSSEELEILILLHAGANLQEIGQSLTRDTSVISRRLSSLHVKYPLLQKSGVRWQLTPLGVRMAVWADQIRREQARHLLSDQEVRISAPREFAGRVMVKDLDWFLKNFGTVHFATGDQGIEETLLAGRADFGFDCGAPHSPEIAFKKVCREDLVFVRTPGKEPFESLPYFHYERMSVSEVRDRTKAALSLRASFHDIASLRTGLLTLPAWSLLPRYVVADELRAETLIVERSLSPPKSMHFGIWWHRSRPISAERLKKATAWLTRQSGMLSDET